MSLDPRWKKVKTSITFFVCLGLKRAENFFGGYKKFQKKKKNKGDPPKKWEFFKKKFFAFVNFKNIHFVKIS